MKYNLFTKKGFTLIELLIVVAIIAILAAIAIPNFLAAQIRAKVSRVKENMATTATALESYYVDNNDYPLENSQNAGPGGSTWQVPSNVTTPIAYITSVPDDIFDLSKTSEGGIYRIKWNIAGYFYGWYVNTANGTAATDSYFPDRKSNNSGIQYVIFSEGPGEQIGLTAGGLGVNSYLWYLQSEPVVTGGTGYDEICQPYRYWYDPTNGTVSLGYVTRQSGGGNSP